MTGARDKPLRHVHSCRKHHDEEVALSKKIIIIIINKIKRNSRLECKSRYPIYYQHGGKMAKINTLFMTKAAEKPYPLGLYLYTPYKGVPQLPPR